MQDWTLVCIWSLPLGIRRPWRKAQMGTPGSSPHAPGLPCTTKLQSDFWHLLQTVSRCNCFILFGGAEYDLVSSTVHTGGQVWLLEHNGA